MPRPARRARSSRQRTIWLAHVLAYGAVVCAVAGCNDSGPRTDEAPSAYTVTIDLGDDVRALALVDSDENDEAGQTAMRRLRALGPHARDALIASLSREREPARLAAIELLADIAAGGDDTARAALVRVAHAAPEPTVRAAAVTSLADLRAADSAAAISAALGDDDATVRVAAAGACPGSCTTDSSFAALARMAVSEPNVGHALAALHTLRRLHQDPALSAAIERAARSAGGGVLGGAPAAAATPTTRQVMAALLLADAGDPRGAVVLGAALGTLPAPQLRVHVVRALGVVGGEDAVAGLAALLGDGGVGPVAAEALQSLAERGAPAARTALAATAAAGPEPRQSP